MVLKTNLKLISKTTTLTEKTKSLINDDLKMQSSLIEWIEIVHKKWRGNRSLKTYLIKWLSLALHTWLYFYRIEMDGICRQ